jgi:cysteinyl-tRNA synthetase
MHCSALRVGDDKMSKSLGNFLTIRDALKSYDSEVLRFFLVRPHYRSQIAFSSDMIEESRASLARLYTSLKSAPRQPEEVDWDSAHAQRFAEAMDDDFNTPEAISVLFDMAGAVHRGDAAMAGQLRALGGILGLLQRDPVQFLQSAPQGAAGGPDGARIQALIDARAEAKSQRDFAEADHIRRGLLDQGIILEDGPGGTTWRRR